MAKYISRKNPISVRSLKRKVIGTVVFHHNGAWEDVKFIRVEGGWLRSRTDFAGLHPEVVTSAYVARECNMAFGDITSWARVY